MSRNEASLRGILQAATQRLHHGPDLDDLRRRRQVRERRRRLTTITAAVLIGVGGTALVMYSFDLAESSRPAEQGDVGSGGVPEGALLLAIRDGAAVISAGSREPVLLEEGVRPYDVSADGSVIAGIASGGGRVIELVRMASTEPRGGRPERVLSVERDGMIERPVRWSPIGRSVGFTYAPPAERARGFCVGADQSYQCFPQLGRVLWWDWFPTGERVVAAGGGALRVLDLGTGEASELVAADEPSVLAAYAEAGLGDPQHLAFVNPLWSPSGRHIAALALGPEGSLPVILSADGTPVTFGRPNPDMQKMAWSPAEVLAYSTGVVAEPPESEWTIRLLDPSRGSDELLLSTDQAQDPYILDMVWSPSGRWLAVRQGRQIRIVDTRVSGRDRLLKGLPDVEDGEIALLDWAP